MELGINRWEAVSPETDRREACWNIYFPAAGHSLQAGDALLPENVLQIGQGKKSALAKPQGQFLLLEAAFGYARTVAFTERSRALGM